MNFKTPKLFFFLVLIALAFSQDLTDEEIRNIKEPIIGIDLGTTFSVVAIWRNGVCEVIPNEQGSRITPSVVSFTPSGGFLVGEAAKNNIFQNPKNTLYDVKRLIGRKFSEVQKVDKELFSYELVDVEGRAHIKAQVGNETKIFSPEEVSGLILGKLKKIAETYLNQPVKYAVVTVPAYFNDAQRHATKQAGQLAGLTVLRLLNEPTAASMAYGLYKKDRVDILVFDLGGGTFDVSLLTIDSNIFKVRATNGDMHLGGEDFDLLTTKFLAGVFKEKFGPENDIFQDKKSFQKLKVASEKAKRILSSELEANIEIEALMNGHDFNYKLTRSKFEELNKELFLKTLIPVRQVLADSKLKKKDIDEIVMVGGSTRIPKVRQLLTEFFDGKELEIKINPDEAIGYGAAVQAAVLCGKDGDAGITIMDVTALSLGIETVGGVMTKIIKKNDAIPTESSDTFTTTEDYQTALVIPIFEGERPMTKFNRKLGELELTDIPSARKGVPQIKVTFKLSADGVLDVTAEDTNTKNKRHVQIKKGFLPQSEVDRLLLDAETYAKEDEEFKKTVEARVRLENYLETTKANLANKNIANRIKSKDKSRIQDGLQDVSDWLKKDEEKSKKDIFKKLVDLKKIVQPILAKLTGETIEEVEEEQPEKEQPKDKNTIVIEEKKEEL